MEAEAGGVCDRSRRMEEDGRGGGGRCLQRWPELKAPPAPAAGGGEAGDDGEDEEEDGKSGVLAPGILQHSL